MTGDGTKNWHWIWPPVGATPVNQGLDTEMFDRTDYPYTETFVREAIQNSLDARDDEGKPVIVRFSFHEKKELSTAHRAFLSDVMKFREQARRPAIPEWASGRIKWLVVEDFNSSGLGGALDDRMGDFWGYWLNFGISNKDGSQRGGRGIGRVTFLIASKMQTVIGYTRRKEDGVVATCGMCVLRAQMDGKTFRSTHGYMADSAHDSIYNLHPKPVDSDLVSAFELDGFSKPGSETGFALVIPYPHDELTPEGILASSIDHFAPAIMSGSLVIEANDERLDAHTIYGVAGKVGKFINAEAVREDVARYLELIRLGLTSEPLRLPAATGAALTLADTRAAEIVKKVQATVTSELPVVLEIAMPLEQNYKDREVTLRAVVQRTPAGKQPIDRLFREGMSLPDARARNPGEMDMILLVDDGDLATYLNLCEGKAHLDLLETKEIRAKLTERKYTGRTPYRVMRFVRNLPVNLRLLLTPDTEDPDASVFDAFFSLPSDKPGKSTGKGPDVPPPPPPPPPPERVRIFNVVQLQDGLAVKANPEFKDWPVNLTMRIAYADGSRSPSWSEFDFRLEDMPLQHANCAIAIEENRIKATECGPETEIRITGFDVKRELDASIRPWKYAQTD